MERFDELKLKYQSVLNLIQDKGVQLDHLHVQDNKLFVQGICPSQEIKNAIWNQVKRVDPSFRDLTCDLLVEEGLSSPAPEMPASADPVPGSTMNPILDMLLNAAGGGAVQQVGQRFGLSGDQATSALSHLVPALMAGLQRNASQQGGMEALLGALNSGNHAQYLDQPELLEQETTTQDGNSILGHIFGSKDVSRAVAGRAAAQTGIGSDILKKMLPVVATMVMGGISKQNAIAPAHESEAGGGSLLTSLFDQNRSGTMADEVVGLLGRFMSGR